MSTISDLLCSGGDNRIIINPDTGMNRYMTRPCPHDGISYASSTANDIGQDAWVYLHELWQAMGCPKQLDGASYSQALWDIGYRIRNIYGIHEDNQFVFAPSGTDLEYVALLVAAGRDNRPVCNILLGANEVGSGCIYSASGQYFANETVLQEATPKGERVPGLPPVELSEIPVRNADGTALSSRHITDLIRTQIHKALEAGQHPLVHIVHGSKTGLILPDINDVDCLRAEFGDQLSFVVDACQARITTGALQAYLQRDMVVLLTGSKFIGGPPFSGFAIVPSRLVKDAADIAEGFAKIFHKAEWPQIWPGRERLSNGGNLGLVLRLSAAVFELERFMALPMTCVLTILDSFEAQLTQLAHDLGWRRVLPHQPDDPVEAQLYPVEMRTLATFDCNDADQPDAICFDEATRIHRAMVQKGVRLGQPVRYRQIVRDGCGGTLRIGLSMPQITAFSKLSDRDLHQKLTHDFAAIRRAYRSTVCKMAGAV